jgi:hypothetical protein
MAMTILKKRFDALENWVIIFGRIYSGWETSLYLGFGKKAVLCRHRM